MTECDISAAFQWTWLHSSNSTHSFETWASSFVLCTDRSLVFRLRNALIGAAQELHLRAPRLPDEGCNCRVPIGLTGLTQQCLQKIP